MSRNSCRWSGIQKKGGEDMYETLEIVVGIAFVVVAAIAIIGNLKKKKKSENQDDK